MSLLQGKDVSKWLICSRKKYYFEMWWSTVNAFFNGTFTHPTIVWLPHSVSLWKYVLMLFKYVYGNQHRCFQNAIHVENACINEKWLLDLNDFVTLDLTSSLSFDPNFALKRSFTLCHSQLKPIKSTETDNETTKVIFSLPIH